jgi:hypothetical protein
MRILFISLLGLSAAALELRSPSGNVSAIVPWQPEGTIQLDIKDETGLQACRIELMQQEVTVLAMHPREKHLSKLRRPFSRLADLPNEAGNLELLIKFRHERWLVFAGNDLILRMPALFPPRQLELSPTPLADSLHLQKIGPIRFDDDFIADEKDKALAKWSIDSGDWRIRTVQEDALDQKSFDSPGREFVAATHSPHFFTLIGKADESPGIISAGYPFADEYSLRASIQPQPGEMGLVFYKRGRSYYAFTLDMPADSSHPTILKLWRRGFGRIPNVEVLAAASVDLARDQWVSLKARAADGHIRCMIDNTTVIDIAEPLPPSGRFGLYLRSPHTVRFDDVHMASVPELPLDTLADIAFHTVAGDPDLYRRVSKASAVGGDLILPIAPHPQWLVFGSKGATPERFAIHCDPRGRHYDLGVICGYQADNRAHYRFRCQRQSNGERFVLERVLGSVVRQIESWEQPARSSGALRLAIAHEDGKLRCYRGDELVLLHTLAKPLAGACGVYSGGGTQIRISEIDYRHVAPPPLRDQREKNTVYQADPYMRHWSSPEGNWYTDGDKRSWHKSDFFGRFRLHMPRVANAEVHIGMRDRKADSAYYVRCAGDRLALFDGRDQELIAIPWQDGDEDWDLHADGHYLCLQIDRRERQYRIPAPLRGTRIRIDGFKTKDLVDSWVDRYQVKDYLFTEAPHEWIINGGKWQVINRFQCDPRFSHLNGENADDRAAMWTKYNFSGDFCVELYAGIRHGWYERLGDINMTMMNRGHSPSRGYTVTCTEWDPEHSQEWNTFFREGVALARSNAYTIPRTRHNNVRKVTEPLIKSGRDVHGAWYYLKLRRIGKHITYTFDNEEIFSLVDNEPLQDGPFGLWTFLNSVVVARVKIAAEQITPREMPFRRLDPSALPRPAEPPGLEVTDFGDAFTAFAAGAQAWKAADRVGQPVLSWRLESTQPPAFTMRNRLGGGAFFAKSAHPQLRSSQIAGFRFDLRRDAEARFNFHYRVWQGDKLIERSFLQLCGSNYNRGNYRLRGAADIPAGKIYTRIHAWIPGEFIDDKHLIEVDGFGNRQPGPDLAGLGGNGIGASYSVRGFTPILTAPPELRQESFGFVPRSIILLDEESGKLLYRGGSLEAANAALRKQDRLGLNSVECRLVNAEHDMLTRPIVWLNLPEAPELSIGWAEKPRTLLLRTSQPEPRVAKMRFYANKSELPVSQVDARSWELTLPRTPAIQEIAELEARLGEERSLLSIPWQTGRPAEAPVLLRLDGLPLFENFERDKGPYALRAETARFAIADFADGRGARVFNTTYKQRLRSYVLCDASLARYPVLAFRYQAERMARISLWPRFGRYAKLSEDFGKPIRGGGLELDGRWHRWQGRISDALGDVPLSNRSFRPGYIYLGSRHEFDQTGRHTHLALDDLVCGPALSDSSELSITPTYYDVDGVYGVYHAVLPGNTAWRLMSAEQRGQLSWQRSNNAEPISVKPGALADGPASLFIRATDYQNQLSQVAQIPLLIDRQPPRMTHEFADSKSADGNGRELRIRFVSGDGAPMDIDVLELRKGDKPIELTEDLHARLQVAHTPSADELVIDWPYLFRHELNALDDGDRLRLGLANIADGAGNRLDDQLVDIVIAHEGDTLGPTWLPMDLSKAVRWRPNWYGPGAGLDMAGGGNAKISLVREFGQEPYLRLSASGSKSSIRRDVKEWVIEEHPYVSFWVRMPKLPPETHSILVSADGEKDGEVAIWPGNDIIRWEEGSWHPVTLDMRKHGAAGKATWLDIARMRVTARSYMDVAGLLVHRKWEADDALQLQGYDASGIKHVEWEFIDAAGNVDRQGRAPMELLRPASLGLTGGAGKWLHIYLVDKADNRSLPLRIPLP